MAKPTETELKLLRLLWRDQRMSARELHDAVSENTDWSYSTTRTLLERMAAKGLVTSERVHGLKVFAPAVSKLATVAGLADAFARNVLELDGPLPAATFAQSKLIDPEEIEALEALLEELNADGEGEG